MIFLKRWQKVENVQAAVFTVCAERTLLKCHGTLLSLPEGTWGQTALKNFKITIFTFCLDYCNAMFSYFIHLMLDTLA